MLEPIFGGDPYEYWSIGQVVSLMIWEGVK